MDLLEVRSICKTYGSGEAAVYALKEVSSSGAAIRAIRDMADGKYSVSDQRQLNQETNGTFRMMSLLVYGFLFIVAMITVFYIINSISMNVSAKMKQYGAMRAIGMSVKQLTKMIAVEAVTYAVCGCIAGCTVGLPLHLSDYSKTCNKSLGCFLEYTCYGNACHTSACIRFSRFSSLYSGKAD